MINKAILGIIFLVSITCYAQNPDTTKITLIEDSINIFILDTNLVQANEQDTVFIMIRDTLTYVNSHSEYNELTLENIDESTVKYFSKQDASPSIFLIEGYMFQGVSVFLEGKEKSVEKAWSAYLYKTNRIKIKSKKAKSIINKKKTPYWKANEVSLTNVTHRIGDLITVFQRENGMVKMTVIFKLGYNTSANTENFPQAYARLTNYVEQFSRVNFQEYYGEHLKDLTQSIKVVDKEIKKESKVLKQMKKSVKRKIKNEGRTNDFDELSVEIQNKLINSLREERNNYEILIVKYKNRNSQLRGQKFTQVN